MSSPISLDAVQLSPEKFAERHPHPFLVFECSPGDSGASDFGPKTSLSYETLGKADSLGGPGDIASPVVKRPGANPFRFIAIGRGSTNDVVVPSSVVSKFHALIRNEGEQFSLVDHDSTNGTSVNGVDLSRDRPVPLNPGDEIVFGGAVKALFLDPVATRKWLRMHC